MSIQLAQTVPFGRSFREYERMFALSPGERCSRLLDCAAGPASFNAEATAAGWTVTSIDPLYHCSGIEIQARFHQVLDHVIDQIRATPSHWVWTFHRDPDELRRHRLDAMARFVEDFQPGRASGRYLCGALPTLPFAADQFDLALCSHFLFLYSDQYDQAFHLAAIHELLRVSREVRLFPLLTLAGTPSPHLAPIRDALRHAGWDQAIVPVSYELQRGGNQMLRIRRS